MNTPNEDESQLLFANELKKLKLLAERDAQSIEIDTDKLSAQAESQFLDYVMAFEKAAEQKKTAKIRNVLGSPAVPDIADIPEEQVTTCLEYLFQIMAKENIFLDTIYEVSDKELYRFITQELFEHEMNIIEVEGLQTQFTYEEFHPNDIEDVKAYALEFIEPLFQKKYDSAAHQLWEEMTFNGSKGTIEEFVAWLTDRLSNYSFTLKNCETTISQLDDEAAVVNCDIELEYTTSVGQSQKLQTSINLGFCFAYGYWYMNSAVMPFVDGL